MTNAIVFKRAGYEPFIDFIKAYAIICVLIGHTLPVTHFGYGLWAGMQVPLFILVQTFHFYKKDDSKLNIKKVFQRIFFPFVTIGLLEFGVYSVAAGGGQNLIIKWMINGGAYGPGSYFPIIYIQIAMLLPCFRCFFRRLNRIHLLVLFIILAEGLEMVCSLTQPPEWLYRLLAVRYVFLIYLGWTWVQNGIKLNKRMIVLSLLSASTIIYFEYLSSYLHLNNEPWFFNTAWTFHRWPCYYFCANGLVYFMYVIWKWLCKTECIKIIIKELAKSSYEIFLVQMCACDAIYLLHIPSLFKVIVIWAISIVGGVAFNRIINLSPKLFRIK